MAGDIEVKKVRRRRKKEPSELKSIKSAAAVSDLYQSQADTAKRIKEVGIDEAVSEASESNAGLVNPGVEGAEADIPVSESDAIRKSALDSISTFSSSPEEPKRVKKTEKAAPSDLKSGSAGAEKKNIYLEYEKKGVGKIDNGQQKPVNAPAPQGYDPSDAAEHRKRVKIINIVVIVLEVIILGIVLYFLFHFKGLLEEQDFGTGSESSYSEEAGEAEEAGGYESLNTPATIDFSNDKFALRCTRLQITRDVDGNPAALIYFTFVNKTDTPLSMSEVFPPMVVQDEIMCETFASLESPPDEFYNRDTQIANGEGIDCAYSVKLQNTTDPVTLTIHDNYETYEDVASTVINLQ